MSALYLAELNAIGGGGNHPIAGGQYPPIVEQVVLITSPFVLSNPFNPNTTLLRINVDTPCSIAIGVNPIAAVTSTRLAANQTEYFSIPPNSGYRLAVIVNS
jgi:hypothetical protein